MTEEGNKSLKRHGSNFPSRASNSAPNIGGNFEFPTNEIDLNERYLVIHRILCSPDSKVLIGVKKEDHKKVAIKLFPKRYFGSQYQRESIDNIKNFSHRNIVEIIETIEKDNYIAHVMIFYPDGDLWTNLRDGTPFSADTIRKIMYDLTEAMFHVHGQHIVHGNINLDNILLDNIDVKTPRACLTGFSIAREEKIYLEMLPDFKPDIYTADEVAKNGFLSYKSDVFALGTVFFFMLSEFDDRTDMNSDDNRAFSNDGHDFVSKMLIKNPEERWKFKKLRKHKFLEEIALQESEVKPWKWKWFKDLMLESDSSGEQSCNDESGED